MRLLGAFFAEKATVNEAGNPNLFGCGIGRTVVPVGTQSISPAIVCLFESGGDDVGAEAAITVNPIDTEGNQLPGQRFTSVIPGIIQVVPLSQDVVVLPIRPEGGHHVYVVRCGDDVHVLPLDIAINPEQQLP